MMNLKIIISIFCSLTLIFAFTPYISAKNSLFGVIVGNGKKNKVLKQLSFYYCFSCCLGGICAALFSIWQQKIFTTVIISLVYCIFALLLFMICGKYLKNLVANNEIQTNNSEIYLKTESESTSAKGISPLWNLFSLPFFTAICVFTVKNFNKPFLSILICSGIVIISAISVTIIINNSKIFLRSNEIIEECKRAKKSRKFLTASVLIINIIINILLLLTQLCYLKILPKSNILEYSLIFLPVIIAISLIVSSIIINKD